MRIAMLLHKSVEHDSRVRRAARALAEGGHEVTVLHLPPVAGELDGELEGFEVRSVAPPRWARRLPGSVRRALSALAFVAAARRLRPDAVHAHDAAMLVPGWLGARPSRARLVYDSHELATGVPYRERFWAWLVAAIERLAVPRCDLVITVSDGIAETLQARYRLAARPVVVRNLPDPAERDPDFEAPDLWRQLDLDAGSTLVLHLGAAAPDRGCEALVGAMSALPEAHLLFLGADDSGFVRELRGLAQDRQVADRVHFRSSVPVGQIRAHTRQASVGVSLLEDSCENHRLALPNKVFEYIAAGIPVVAADLPELRRLLDRRPGAVLVDTGDEQAVAAALVEAMAAEAAAAPAGPEWPEDAARLVAAYAALAGTGPAIGKRAVVLVRNGVSHDARILREARLLGSMGFETTVVGVVTAADPDRSESVGGVSVLRLDPGGGLRRASRRLPTGRRSASGNGPPPRAGQAAAAPSSTSGRARLRRLIGTADYYRRGVRLVRRVRPRLIHANDYNTAWIGVIGKWLTGARLVYDSHELWPDRNLRPEPRPWLLLCESLFVRVADEVITTSPGYAQVLARRYRIPTPQLIRNLPDWTAERTVRERAGGEAPLAVYFGALTRNRGLGTALRALALVPELQMRFVGPDAWGYRQTLLDLAEELGVADRLELLDPVPPVQAASVLADADLGLALIEPACLSYRMTLPNKLYEYVAAGLPVLSSDVPVLADEVRRHGLGLIADARDPIAVAAAIRAMVEPAAQARFRGGVSVLAPSAQWSAEKHALARIYGAPARRRRAPLA
jgi:glycosyltransferase involved in cell wall biosynthesis